jgi:hypothetical protein
MLRSMLVLSLLVLPVMARAQEKKAEGDERLAALETKLQALLKEIHDLRGAKAEAGPAEKEKVVRFRLDEAKKKAAEAEEKGKGHAPRVVRIGEDGKPVEIQLELKLEDLKDAEKLKKLGVEQLDKLKNLKDMEQYKRAIGELAKLKDVELKLQLEKPKEVAGAKALNADEAKKLGMEGKRVIIDEKTGKIIRAEVQPKPQGGGVEFRVAGPVHAYTVVGAGGGDSNRIDLSRVTYTLGGAQAKALDEFLKAFAKAKVLETKIDGDKLVVTTTPEVQATIGQVVNLMTGTRTTTTHRVETRTEGKAIEMLLVPSQDPKAGKK